MLDARLVAAVAIPLALAGASPSFAGLTAQQKCTIAKVAAANKKAASQLKCYVKALRKHVPIDPLCLAKAEQTFADAFAKAAAKSKGVCSASDVNAVGGGADDFLARTIALEPDVAVCLPAVSACSLFVPDPIPCCPGLVCQPDNGGVAASCKP